MGQLKVLVVEDDVFVLMASAHALRTCGFEVMEAESADIAWSILHQMGAETAVVFSDIETPGALDGVGLAGAIRRDWPAIRVILTSGHVTPPPEALGCIAGFMPKPYDLERVAALISDLTAPAAEV